MILAHLANVFDVTLRKRCDADFFSRTPDCANS